MTHMVTIRSHPATGGTVEIVVEVAGPDSAVLTTRSWSLPNPGPADKPDSVSSHSPYNIRLSPSKTSISCRVSESGMKPLVVCSLSDPAATAKRSVTIAVSGTMFGLFDRTDIYPLQETDYAALKDFFATSGFPSAAS
jgi:hypothetical protein